METSAIAELKAGFDEPFAELGRNAEQDRRAVVISWPSIPVEIVRAAGLKLVLARGAAAPTPAADEVLEAGIFPNRLKQLFEAALTGRLANVAAVVLPRTSDADYKGFLYLRELARQGRIGALPPVLLFDLLQSEGTEVADYDRERSRVLYHRLCLISGQPPGAEGLRLEIQRANAARAAARRLLAHRSCEPRIGGAEALPLLGAFWQLPPARYAALAGTAAETIAARAPLAGPRVLLAGVPVDSSGLHAAIESRGAVVVGEISALGSCLAGEDVEPGAEPLEALADKYRGDSITARAPRESLWQRLESALGSVDAVVVSLPPDDACFGWDYPLLHERLDGRGIPHCVLDGDPSSAMTAPDCERLDAALAATATRREARYG